MPPFAVHVHVQSVHRALKSDQRMSNLCKGPM